MNINTRNYSFRLKNSKLIWLVNIGENLPSQGNRPLRMCVWKNQLEDQGYEVTFYTSDFEHQRKQWLRSAPNGFILLKSYISYRKNISIARLLNHFLVAISLLSAFIRSKKKPDVILVSYPTIWLSFISVIYGKIKGVKVIVDVRDKWPDIFITHPVLRIFLWPLSVLKNYIFRNADSLITISPGYYQWALPHPHKQLEEDCILPLVQADSKHLKRKIEASKPLNLIFVGSLGTTYDLDLIININDTLAQTKIPFTIHVCGDGPRAAEIIKKSAGRKNIALAGWLNKAALQQKLDEAHFGLMLYNANSPQGWPNKLLEYMANGLPILNTLQGESWKLIEDAKLGLNFDRNSINKVADWLFDLKNMPENYQYFVQNNYRISNSQFSERANFQKLLKHIE